MDSHNILDAIGDINDDAIRDARAGAATASRPHFGRRLPAAMIAAILALLLMGAGIVAVIYGDSIQNWFGHYWEAITGQQMSDEQTAIINHLSQEIGACQTVGDVTITVDSATVGDDTFYLLLKVDGLSFSNKNSYNFLMGTLETTPNPLEDGAFVGWGTDYLGVDGDGSALLLLNYEYVSNGDFAQDTRPLQVSLWLENLASGAHTNKEKIIAEGEWYFSFVIDRSELPEVILLPDTEIMAVDSTQQEEIPVTLTNIELTNTGLRFQFEYNEGNLSLSEQDISIVLNNGKTIGNNGGIGSPTNDNKNMRFSYQWLVPVNLDEVAAVQIGNIQISVP